MKPKKIRVSTSKNEYTVGRNKMVTWVVTCKADGRRVTGTSEAEAMRKFMTDHFHPVHPSCHIKRV